MWDRGETGMRHMQNKEQPQELNKQVNTKEGVQMFLLH